MLNKKVKKETFDRSILTFEAWVHFLQQRQHTNMTKMEKTTPPDTEIPTSILNEPVSVSVSVKEKK